MLAREIFNLECLHSVALSSLFQARESEGVEAARFELASLTFEVRSFYMLSRYFKCPLQTLTGRILKGKLYVAFISPAKSIFLYSPTYYYITRNTIRGVEIGTVALTDERFSEVNQWYENTRRVLK